MIARVHQFHPPTQTQIFLLLVIIALTLAGVIVCLFQPWYFFSRQDPINSTAIIDNSSTEKLAIYNNQLINIPSIPNYQPSILGDTTQAEEKRIEIDLTQQRLYAFEGNRLVYSFLISSGKWDRTPTGTFTIWTKIRSQKMSGGSKELGTYYYLPNVPYIMFFYNEKVAKNVGYSLHGTYWHDNFGVPMSHGCINMRTEDVAQIYYWANPALNNKPSILATPDNPGTKVIIYGKYQYQISLR